MCTPELKHPKMGSLTIINKGIIEVVEVCWLAKTPYCWHGSFQNETCIGLSQETSSCLDDSQIFGWFIYTKDKKCHVTWEIWAICSFLSPWGNGTYQWCEGLTPVCVLRGPHVIWGESMLTVFKASSSPLRPVLSLSLKADVRKPEFSSFSGVTT